MFSFEQISDYYFILRRDDDVATLIPDLQEWADANIKNHYERKVMVNKWECQYLGEYWHFSSLDDAMLFKLRWQ